jgi:CRISPR-associated protein Cas2
MPRIVYLIAYDICEPKRLARVHRLLMGYKIGGQKSVYECWLTPGELADLRVRLEGLILPEKDRVHFLQLDPRMAMRGFGKATPAAPGYFAIL